MGEVAYATYSGEAVTPDEEAAALGVVLGELALEVLKRGDQIVPAQTPYELAKQTAMSAILLMVDLAGADKEKGPESEDPEPVICREKDSRCICFCRD